MDTTYNVSIVAYPLLTIMADDGDGRAKPVAYCFQRSKTKDSLKKIIDSFCKTNHYANTPMQYTASFHCCKNDNFQLIFSDFFHIFA